MLRRGRVRPTGRPTRLEKGQGGPGVPDGRSVCGRYDPSFPGWREIPQPPSLCPSVPVGLGRSTFGVLFSIGTTFRGATTTPRSV